jgi:hypothetical protein
MLQNLSVAALLVATVKAACWSQSQGYKCCSSASVPVVFTDDSGDWGVENGDWCGIPKEEKATCFAEKFGFSCCPAGTAVIYTDSDGEWGINNGDWCGIDEPCCGPICWSEKFGYPCCKTTNVVQYTDNDGKWGFENGDWCGINGNVKVTTTTTRRTTTTTRKTTTTTRYVRPTYSVIYETGKKLNTGFENWGWDAKLTFKDSAMVVTSDKSSYGAASIKKLSGYYGTGGCIHALAKSETKAFIRVQGLAGEDEKLSFDVGTIDGDEYDFTEYIFDVDPTYKFDRIIIQDGSASGRPINIRYLIYSTGSCSDFNPPVDTSYVPVVTTTKKSNVRAVYTTIFKNAYSMPNGYDDWGWGCSVSYSGGAMVIRPEEGEYGAVSLKRLSGTFNGGSLRFDMKNEGKVNVMVENSDRDEKYTLDTIDPSDDFQTYILDIDFDTFDRINFQDAKGTGDRIWIKNLVHSTGAAEDFVDPI